MGSRLQRQLGGSRRGGRHHQDHHDYNQDHYDDQGQHQHAYKDDNHQHEQVKPLAWLLGVNEAKDGLPMESSCLSLSISLAPKIQSEDRTTPDVTLDKREQTFLV